MGFIGRIQRGNIVNMWHSPSFDLTYVSRIEFESVCQNIHNLAGRAPTETVIKDF